MLSYVTNRILSFALAAARRRGAAAAVASAALGLVGVGLADRPAQASPPGFIENRGQVDAQVLYYSHGPGGSVWITRDEIVIGLYEPRGAITVRRAPGEAPERDISSHAAFSGEPRFRGSAVRIRFAGSIDPAGVEAREPTPQQYHYYLGDDPSRWRRDVPAYREIVFRMLWPGTDLILRQDDSGVAFSCRATGAARIPAEPFVYEGATVVTDEDQGVVELRTGSGSIRQTMQRERDGREARGVFSIRRVPGNPRAKNEGLPGEKDNPSALAWGSYLGGSNDDRAMGVAFDASPAVFVGGYTESANFPIFSGDNTYGGSRDGFIAAFEPDGFFLGTSFIGGSGSDEVTDVFGLDGTLLVMGFTQSTNFPVTSGAYDTTPNGLSDGFLMHMTLGMVPIWSSYIGGSQNDSVDGACWASGGWQVHLACTTASPNFPVTPGAFDSSFNGIKDAAVCRFDVSTQQMIWSTFVGGNSLDTSGGITVTADGRPVLVGATHSSNFPVTAGAYDTTIGGVPDGDAFALQLNQTGTAVLFGTFLGGTALDDAYSVALDSGGNVLVCGVTKSADFPVTPGALDVTYNPGGGALASDGFACRLSGSASQLQWGTFVGGSDYDALYAIDTLPGDRPVVAGVVNSVDLPTTPDGFDTTPGTSGDNGYIAVLRTDGTGITWGSYLGGTGFDGIFDAEVDEDGWLVLAGDTEAPDFPATPGTFDATYNGASDGTIVRMRMPAVAGAPQTGPEGGSPGGLRVLGEVRSGALLAYVLPGPAQATLEVFDAQGRLVDTLVRERQERGEHRVAWDPSDARAPSGVYFARLRAEGMSARTTRVVIAR